MDQHNNNENSATFVLVMSLVRTLVPVVVGSVLAWFAAKGLPVDPDLETTLTVALTGLATFVYYAVVRLLEVKVSPWWGNLLGTKNSPDSYSPGRPPYDAAPAEEDGLAEDVVRVDRPVVTD